VSARYKHAGAREGIRELITELGKAEDQRRSKDVLFFVLSMKWIHLIAAGSEPPRTVLIRPFNEFTVGYTTHFPCNNPALDNDNHVEVVRTDEGQLCFLENGHLLAADEFASKLIRLVTAS
jgi:hypothetical protein